MTAFTPKPRSGRIALDMTPMIDIVFQLLTFFCMTLKIATSEGDFHMQMPREAPGPYVPSVDQLPPLTVILEADSAGELTRLALNEKEFSGANRLRLLHQHLRNLVDSYPRAAEAEVVLRCDSKLNYQYVIDAMTAVSGSKNPRGEIVPLIRRIQFVPLK